MALLDTPACLGPVLEDDQLFTAALAHHFRAHLRLRDQRPADCGPIAIGDQEHPAERHGLSGFGLQALNLELGPDLDAVLLSARLDDCVHGSSENAIGLIARKAQ